MSGVDTSIYGNLLRPPKSVQEYGAEMDAAQQNQIGLQQARIGLQAAQQGQQDEQALRQLYQRPDFNPQTDEGVAALMRISPKAGAAAYAARLAADKTKAETEHVQAQTGQAKSATEKAAIEAAGARLKQYRDTLDFVDTPQGAARWLKAQFDDPLTAPQMGALGSFEQAATRIPQDPQGFQQWRSMAAQGMERHMAQMQAAANAAETVRHNRTAEGLTARGQNMADARAREVTAATVTKPFEVTGPDGSPMLVRQDRQGNITPVQGFGPKSGASKPLTDTQAKALLFGSRMQEADKILGNMADRGVDRPGGIKQIAEGTGRVLGLGTDSAGGALSGIAGSLTNWTQSEDQQSVEQAQRDFVNAVLRRESGAAISPSEFESAQKQYFPAVGDSDQVKAQKAKNRKIAIQGLLAEVPEGKRASLSPPSGGASGGWSVVEVK